MVEYVTSHYSEWEDSIDIKSNIDILWPRTLLLKFSLLKNQPVFWIIQLLIESNFGNCLCKLFQLFMANIPHCSSHWTSPVVNWLLFYSVNLVKKNHFSCQLKFLLISTIPQSPARKEMEVWWLTSQKYFLSQKCDLVSDIVSQQGDNEGWGLELLWATEKIKQRKLARSDLIED